ncbi:transglutaminase domain-containing protein [Microbacterium sp. 179-B 1A2 NHS]|uniref:transglutaminase domain-containing protein n=1 Tax=Microbacterium sp. 179-B 1A2 NHS TaxID=3142383 RepID=UPI0039A394C3
MSDVNRRGLRAARNARERNARVRFLGTQALLLDALFLVGAVATWPVYRSPLFAVAVLAGLVAAHVVAALGLRGRWSGWWVALAALGAYVVLGLPVAAPGSLGSPTTAVRALLGILTAPVTGWKDILTLELPLGSYQTTLAPVLFLFIAIPTVALSCAWRSARWWMLSVPAGMLLTVFGVVFGARSLAAPLPLGPVTVQPEALVGAAALVTGLGAIVWRTRHERHRALETAVAASGVRTTGRANRGLAGRTAMALGMLVIAVVAAAGWAPWALAGQPRDVARSAIDPVLEVATTLSPLSQYRAAFTDDDAYSDVLFRVDAPAGVERIRLATLPFYDGRTARAVDPDTGLGDPATAFTRVPSQIDTGTDGTARVTVTIEDLRGIWVPTTGRLSSLAFSGARAADLADGFFHNAATGSAVQLAEPGFASGDAYTLSAVVDPAAPDAASLTPARSGPALPEAVVPDSLRQWVEAQEAPDGGAGLALLIDRLRARGFLSHALTIDEGAPPAWLSDLGGDDFQPSRAGHSTDRIDELFGDLLDRQREFGGTDDAALVAGVGDEEQFAVAGMLVADQLGFDARVVVGTRLASAEELPACEDGVCRNAELAAWIEVQGARGTWVPLDVTPQHEAFPSPDLEQRQDPQNPTEVRNENAEQVLPADADPSDGTKRGDDVTDEGADLGALWAALRIAGISLLGLAIVLGPLLLIIAAKAFRRRSRRRNDDPIERFTGGWQEYVDAAVDHGYPVPRSHTRQELASLYAGEDAGNGARLATWADRSVFDVSPPTAGEDAEFWRIVDAERTRFASEKGFWARIRARVSLRSLVRGERSRGRRRG